MIFHFLIKNYYSNNHNILREGSLFSGNRNVYAVLHEAEMYRHKCTDVTTSKVNSGKSVEKMHFILFLLKKKRPTMWNNLFSTKGGQL